MQRLNPALALLSIGLVAACAAPGDDHPSLAQRPAEREGGVRRASTDGLALIDPAPPAPAVQERIDRQLAAAGTAHRRFLAALPGARRAVADGGRAGVESDAYAAAQIAVGNLQAISSETAFAVADLDALLAVRSNALQSTEAVAVARDAAAALLQQENATLDTLERSLR
jgi:hypothetical protein